MPASFNSLPVEMVVEVVNHVDHHNHHNCGDRHTRPCIPQSTLAALNRTSKLLNSLTTRHLYRAPRYRHSNWPLFARTLIVRKDLAALVKHLYFSGENDHLDPAKFPEEITAYYLEYYEVCNPLTVDDPASDTEALFVASGRGRREACVEMDFIVHLCAQTVETIFVDVSLYHDAFLLMQAPTALPALKTIIFDYMHAIEDGHLYLTPRLNDLIKAAAPALTRLELSRLCLDQRHMYGGVLEGVTHLVIRCSAMRAWIFDTLLSLVPNLEILEYEGGAGNDSKWCVRVHEAYDSIVRNCEKLKSFCFDMSAVPDVDWASPRPWESVMKIRTATDFASKGIKFQMTQ
ncbi:hypothetical protein QBC37DRAFT_416097 [Rhypophila decipiens]|uniref:Uncharacterized protein n=1 Tax=Rhypophila decipiens TaxID=261697 RepID=A0AAN6YIF1_9PEZI|nr:hypothetical protein QBC37DRAFT_416097 [Rhypophila decipiens]